MQIVKGRVNWREHWDNRPEIFVLVDKLPNEDDLVYERRGNIYYAEKDGYATFLQYDSPSNGFGGRHFKLKMKDGSIALLKGPWSSSSNAANHHGFGPCVDVAITDKPDVWERGHTFFSGHVTVACLEEASEKGLIDIGESYVRKLHSGGTYGRKRNFKRNKGRFVLIQIGGENSAPVFDERGSFEQLQVLGGAGGIRFEAGVVFPDGKIWTKPY